MKKKIIFLYTELASYSVACMNMASEEVDIMIVKYPVNDEAPFSFQLSDSLLVESRDQNSYNLLKKIVKFKAHTVVVSGWSDLSYLSIAFILRYLVRSNATIVVAFDNTWHGTRRQKLGKYALRFLIKILFHKAWVSGPPQKEYSRMLRIEDVSEGFYCCDTNLFKDIFSNRLFRGSSRTKKLLFVGRYVKQKGLEELCSAFINVTERTGCNWELYCVGTGELFESRPRHPAIKHLGFVQPSDLGPIILEAHAFVLPSFCEPWGVVVQEMAISGLPILTTNDVGSASVYVKEEINGYITDSRQTGLELGLEKLFGLSDVELEKMSLGSNKIGMEYTIDNWVGILKNL